VIVTTSFTCAGRKPVNQDTVLIESLKDGQTLLAIADGMGGEDGGEIASKLAISTVKNIFKELSNIEMLEVYKQVQEVFVKTVSLTPKLSKMGTTLTLVLIDRSCKKARIAHVGDSRLYHLRNKGLVSRTKDQTELQKLLDDGVISKARAQKYYRKNVLLSVMSANRPYDLQLEDIDLKTRDRLVLLTDGAYSLIRKGEIRDISVVKKSLEEFVSNLKETIESRKIKDDYSVVACEV